MTSIVLLLVVVTAARAKKALELSKLSGFDPARLGPLIGSDIDGRGSQTPQIPTITV